MKDTEKQKALQSVEMVFRQRKFVLLVLIPAVFFFRKLVQLFNIPSLLWVLLLIPSIAIFPVIYFIKLKKETISGKTIYSFLAITFIVELFSLFIIYYLLAPLMSYYFGDLFFPAALFLTLFIIVSNPIFNNRKYSYFFFGLCCLYLIALAVFDYYGLFPSYYPLETVKNFYQPGRLKNVSFSLFLGLAFFSVIQFYIDNFWNMFRKQTQELEKLNDELEKRVTERTQEIEEAKTSLEIKIKARTKELEEITQGLEDKVKQRTQELQEKVNELERFQALTVGRELKMVELKKKIKELEEKLREKIYQRSTKK